MVGRLSLSHLRVRGLGPACARLGPPGVSGPTHGSRHDGRSRAFPRRRGVRRGAHPYHRGPEPPASPRSGMARRELGPCLRDRLCGPSLECRSRESAAHASPMPRGATWAVGAILVVTGVIAILAPPNNWDSMTYHMPRSARLEPERIGRSLPDAHPASALARALGRVRDHAPVPPDRRRPPGEPRAVAGVRRLRRGRGHRGRRARRRPAGARAGSGGLHRLFP